MWKTWFWAWPLFVGARDAVRDELDGDDEHHQASIGRFSIQTGRGIVCFALSRWLPFAATKASQLTKPLCCFFAVRLACQNCPVPKPVEPQQPDAWCVTSDLQHVQGILPYPTNSERINKPHYSFCNQLHAFARTLLLRLHHMFRFGEDVGHFVRDPLAFCNSRKMLRVIV